MKHETDDELRRESPAYRPDDAWTEVEPQSLGAVFSVRFDLASGRRIYEAARARGQMPSALIRDWTLRQLAELDDAPPRRAGGVQEAAAEYTPGEMADALRQQYRPERIDLLLVGEARPAGGRFFYQANSNLFYATHEAFQLVLGPVPSGIDFLRFLRERRVWLYDLMPYPVDRLRGRPRRAEVQSRTAELVQLLDTSRPRRIVAIKKDLAAPVRAAMQEAGLAADRLTVLPFPLYQWRLQYTRGLAEVIRLEEADGR